MKVFSVNEIVTLLCQTSGACGYEKAKIRKLVCNHVPQDSILINDTGIMNIFIILCTFNYIRLPLFTYPNTDMIGNYIFVEVFIWG